jgi:hypothetical protein
MPAQSLSTSFAMCLWGLIAIVLAASVCRAQLTTTGTISGTVTDTSRALVIGASIKIQNQNTGLTTTTESNADGSFVVPGLPIASYNVCRAN